MIKLKILNSTYLNYGKFTNQRFVKFIKNKFILILYEMIYLKQFLQILANLVVYIVINKDLALVVQEIDSYLEQNVYA